MGKIVASVRNNRSVGTGATTLTDDIKFNFTAHTLHLDVFGDLAGSDVNTLALGVASVGQVRIETTVSQPQSTIDGADLFNFQQNVGISPYYTANNLTVDGQPKGFALIQPFTPFPMDDTRNYGLPNQRGVQAVVDWIADGTLDDKIYDMTVEGISTDIQPSPLGYIKFIRDAYTSGAVGEENKTRVTGNRLLGCQNFQTSEFEVLAGNAANNITGIRQQAVLFSDNIVLGPYKSFRSWSMGAYAQSLKVSSPTGGIAGNVTNLGAFFSDYGIHNSGKLGLDIAGRTVDIRTTAGVAQATRVNPVVLVT